MWHAQLQLLQQRWVSSLQSVRFQAPQAWQRQQCVHVRLTQDKRVIFHNDQAGECSGGANCRRQPREMVPLQLQAAQVCIGGTFAVCCTSIGSQGAVQLPPPSQPHSAARPCFSTLPCNVRATTPTIGLARGQVAHALLSQREAAQPTVGEQVVRKSGVQHG